jgi:flagellar basal-body rod modification protein FlgD
MQVNSSTPGSSLQDFSIPTSQRTNGSNLTEQDFLKVMVEQLKNQNPLDPQNSDQFFQQIVQFQTLDAMQSMSKQLQSLAEVGGLANASALIGRTVTASIDQSADPTTGMPRPSKTITGVVDSVTFKNGSPVVHVGNNQIPAAKVVEVS